MIVYIAGLQAIPEDIQEATMIDGANRTQRLFRVTIPNMMPSITICTFLTITNSFKLFDQNLALTGGEPLHKTEMLALNIYETFYGRVGYEGVGQAKAVVFFILVVAIGLIQLKITRSKEVQTVMAKIQKTANTADKKPVYRVKEKPTLTGILATLFFTIISIIFVSPIIIVIINSLKAKTFISLETFELPNEHSYIGLDNYKTAITQYDFIKAVGWTVVITVLSVVAILLFCSMTAWYITRVKNIATKIIYLLCVFSMVIPFQMVMFTLAGTADALHLTTPWGNRDRVSWIWNRSCSIHVLRIYQVHSFGGRGGRDDRWMYAAQDIFQGCYPYHETYLHICRNT